MGTKSSMAGWIGFAGILMLIIGGIDFFQGLIALFQLGFLGNSQYPLWALTALALNVVVLVALTARRKESQPELTSAT
jgi:hypothetical protein